MIIYFQAHFNVYATPKDGQLGDISASDHGPSCDGPSDNTVQSRVEVTKLSCHGWLVYGSSLMF